MILHVSKCSGREQVAWCLYQWNPTVRNPQCDCKKIKGFALRIGQYSLTADIFNTCNCAIILTHQCCVGSFCLFFNCRWIRVCCSGETVVHPASSIRFCRCLGRFLHDRLSAVFWLRSSMQRVCRSDLITLDPLETSQDLFQDLSRTSQDKNTPKHRHEIIDKQPPFCSLIRSFVTCPIPHLFSALFHVDRTGLLPCFPGPCVGLCLPCQYKYWCSDSTDTNQFSLSHSLCFASSSLKNNMYARQRQQNTEYENKSERGFSNR